MEVHNRNKGHPRLDVRKNSIEFVFFFELINTNLVTKKI